jgi:hypothetical protein
MEIDDLSHTGSSGEYQNQDSSATENQEVTDLIASLLGENTQPDETALEDLFKSLEDQPSSEGDQSVIATKAGVGLGDLLGKPDLEEKLTKLLMDKFKLSEVQARQTAAALLKKLGAKKRKKTIRKTTSPKPKKKPAASATKPKPKKKRTSTTTPKKKRKSQAKKKTSKPAPKKKASASTAKKETSKTTVKKKTGGTAPKKKKSSASVAKKKPISTKATSAAEDPT